jgi:hypothetical protein
MVYFGRTTSWPCMSAWARIGCEVAVEAERAGTIRAELEGRRAAGRDAADDAVLVDREAVSDVFALDRDLDEIVLDHLEPVSV